MIMLKFKTTDAWAESYRRSDGRIFAGPRRGGEKGLQHGNDHGFALPRQAELVTAMVDLALEELSHFRSVVKLMHERGLTLQPDEKDPYVNAMRRHCRQGSEFYLLDRLLVAAIVEARGAERFGMIAAALPEGELKRFYDAIARSEMGHEKLFVQFAERYFDPALVQLRLDELLDAEAAIVSELPLRLALH